MTCFLYNSMGNFYKHLNYVPVQNNSIEDALRILSRALSRVQINDIIKSSLVMLRVACLSKNIKFPYEITVSSLYIKITSVSLLL